MKIYVFLRGDWWGAGEALISLLCTFPFLNATSFKWLLSLCYYWKMLHYVPMFFLFLLPPALDFLFQIRLIVFNLLCLALKTESL